MNLPDYVKKKAMDAVSHRETTAYMRSLGYSEAMAFSAPALRAGEGQPAGPLSDEAKRMAMDAISHRETAAQITLMRETGSVCMPSTPSRESMRAAERVAMLQRAGVSAAAIQSQLTHDNFHHHHD